MAFKKLSGNINLLIDLSLSSILCAFVNFYDKSITKPVPSVSEFIGGTIGIFFLIFIWSWKRHHIYKKNFVTIFLNILFFTTFYSIFYINFIFIPSLIKNFEAIGLFIVIPTALWGIVIAIKYKNLFLWSKEPKVETRKLSGENNDS